MKRETPTDAPIDSSDKESDQSRGSNTGLFIDISIANVVVIVGLIAVIIYSKKRNQSLVKQINHASFQNNSSRAELNFIFFYSIFVL